MTLSAAGAATVEAVCAMVREGGFRGRRVASCLSTLCLSVKNVRLPHTADGPTREALVAETKERFNLMCAATR